MDKKTTLLDLNEDVLSVMIGILNTNDRVSLWYTCKYLQNVIKTYKFISYLTKETIYPTLRYTAVRGGLERCKQIIEKYEVDLSEEFEIVGANGILNLTKFCHICVKSPPLDVVKYLYEHLQEESKKISEQSFANLVMYLAVNSQKIEVYEYILLKYLDESKNLENNVNSLTNKEKYQKYHYKLNILRTSFRSKDLKIFNITILYIEKEVHEFFFEIYLLLPPVFDSFFKNAKLENFENYFDYLSKLNYDINFDNLIEGSIKGERKDILDLFLNVFGDNVVKEVVKDFIMKNGSDEMKNYIEEKMK